jgi:hypothetical protein
VRAGGCHLERAGERRPIGKITHGPGDGSSVEAAAV